MGWEVSMVSRKIKGHIKKGTIIIVKKPMGLRGSLRTQSDVILSAERCHVPDCDDIVIRGERMKYSHISDVEGLKVIFIPKYETDLEFKRLLL